MPAKHTRDQGISKIWIIVCIAVIVVVAVFVYTRTAGNPLAPQSVQTESSEVISASESMPESSAESTVESSTSNPDAQTKIVYTNNEYGFSVSLPKDFEGYTIVKEDWQGTDLKNTGSATRTFQGPQLSIRDPRWTKQVPRQDIPIMIFTVEQWKQLQNEEFSVGAAPMNPEELGRNSNYVFALPARYNYAFPEGYEEVQTILDGKPLTAFEPKAS